MSKLCAALPLSLLLVACVADVEPFVEPDVPDTISTGDIDDGGDDDIANPPIPDPNPVGPATGAAFVLAHGFGGNADSFAPEIETALKADGHAVLRAAVPGIEGVAVRGAALGLQVDQVLAATGLPQVHIIAHSMGGLDARYMISSLGYSDRVASLTTISTPHQGTPLADLARGVVGDGGDQSLALDLFQALAGDVDPEALDRALVDLSELRAPVFNAGNLDVDGVYYQSFAGLSTVAGFGVSDADTACLTLPATAIPDPDALAAPLALVAPIMAYDDDGNRIAHDGVVAVSSSTYAVFRGCIPADHLDELLVTPDSVYDSVAFFKGIAAELAAP